MLFVERDLLILHPSAEARWSDGASGGNLTPAALPQPPGVPEMVLCPGARSLVHRRHCAFAQLFPASDVLQMRGTQRKRRLRNCRCHRPSLCRPGCTRVPGSGVCPSRGYTRVQGIPGSRVCVLVSEFSHFRASFALVSGSISSPPAPISTYPPINALVATKHFPASKTKSTASCMARDSARQCISGVHILFACTVWVRTRGRLWCGVVVVAVVVLLFVSSSSPPPSSSWSSLDFILVLGLVVVLVFVVAVVLAVDAMNVGWTIVVFGACLPSRAACGWVSTPGGFNSHPNGGAFRSFGWASGRLPLYSPTAGGGARAFVIRCSVVPGSRVYPGLGCTRVPSIAETRDFRVLVML
jgi:hypothetical protein